MTGLVVNQRVNVSRQLLRRLLAIFAAYILALQPIARVTMLHSWDGVAQLCSRAGDDTAPPSGREHEHACCLGTCCRSFCCIAGWTICQCNLLLRTIERFL